LRAIDPGYRPDQEPKAKPSSTAASTPAAASAFSGTTAQRAPAPTPAAVTASIAAPTTKDVDQAATFRRAIPPAIVNWITDTNNAKAVVYAMLSANDDKIESSLTEQVKKTRQWITESKLKVRLPLVGLAVPALRLLSLDDLDAFLQTVHNLIKADNRTTPFEFAVDVLLEYTLKPKAARDTNGADVRSSAVCLLSYLAYAGANGDASAAETAF